MRERRERLVENEKLFRAANERLEERVRDTAEPDGSVPFLCECADADCLGRLDLSLPEYGQVRANENHFIILAGHAKLEEERIVRENGRFEVVAKDSE